MKSHARSLAYSTPFWLGLSIIHCTTPYSTLGPSTRLLWSYFQPLHLCSVDCHIWPLEVVFSFYFPYEFLMGYRCTHELSFSSTVGVSPAGAPSESPLDSSWFVCGSLRECQGGAEPESLYGTPDRGHQWGRCCTDLAQHTVSKSL